MSPERTHLLLIALTSFGFISGQASASASIPPEKVRISEAKKTQNYLKDGLFTGGDQAIQNVVVKNIRRASNSGFERIVIDLEGFLAGEPAVIARAPYFQVAVSPDERRLVVSVWGDPQLQFDAKKVIQNFKKSAWISEVELLPKVEPQFWSFVFHLKSEASVEVFELREPVRIILDVKKNATASL